MTLLLDIENGQLSTSDGMVFRPTDRNWQSLEGGGPTGREVTPIAAVEWLQKTSGVPCRVPVGVIGGRQATPDQLAAAEAIGRHLARMGLTERFRTAFHRV